MATDDEVREKMNQLVYIEAPGTKDGKQQVRIVDYDPNQSSPWGKGVVTIEFPHEQGRGQIKQCIQQVVIINGNGRVKKRKKRKAVKVG